MDPDRLLHEIKVLVRQQLEDSRRRHERFPGGPAEAAHILDKRMDDLCEKVKNLDLWIRNGGFLPREWTQEKVVVAGSLRHPCPDCGTGSVERTGDQTEYCSLGCGWVNGK